MTETDVALVHLAHELDRQDRRLTILGAGDVSAQWVAARFAVQGTCSSLATIQPRRARLPERGPWATWFGLKSPLDCGQTGSVGPATSAAHLLGAAALGGPHFLRPAQIEPIASQAGKAPEQAQLSAG
jgi:hypothetical protein